MIEGVKKKAALNNSIDGKDFNRSISDFYRTFQSGGTFCYTFFKAIGTKR